VLVISGGRIVAEFNDHRPTESEVGRVMLGENE
jgi:hypothetical protein